VDSVVGRRLRLVSVAACLSLAIPAFLVFAPASKSASAAGVSVAAGNDYFCSQAFDGAVCETDIIAGDTVTWNVVAGSHTVTECTAGFAACPPAGGFDSGILVDAQTFVHTFDAPGTYAYRCELHTSEMLGKIVVRAATASPTNSPTPTPLLTPTPSPTVEPTPTAATEAPTPAPTAAALPRTGGAAAGSGAAAWRYVLLAAAMTLLGAGVVAFSGARRK
jgi:plastocyanin